MAGQRLRTCACEAANWWASDVSDAGGGGRRSVPAGTDLLFGETKEDHAFVVEEQMMPFVPIVRVKDADAGIAASVKAEHGYRHTAIIHSQNMTTLHRWRGR